MLNDPQVSRRHLSLSASPEGVVLEDLGSTNGTFWQGARVSRATVGNGATISVGSTQLVMQPAEAPVIEPSAEASFGGLVGQSRAMRELFAVLALAAPSDATILIEGESGTGKEVAAHAVHAASARAQAPFVVVDCSSIPEGLIESYLFGHVKGAFTGAERSRDGAFVEASGGTLFLDELGELPLAAQAKLLRALEDQTVQPVGADRRVSVDTRVIAATHRDLASMVAANQFRFDLYFRLAVVHVALPPLRARPDDVPLLIDTMYQRRQLRPGPISGENLAMLQQYTWPGNVRELRNALERAWALSGGDKTFASLKFWLGTGGGAAVSPAPGLVVDAELPFKDAKEQWNDAFERTYLEQVFAKHEQNISQSAAHAGLSRRHFRELLYKHGLLLRQEQDADEPW